MYGGYESNSYENQQLETRPPLVYLCRLEIQTCHSKQTCYLINLHLPHAACFIMYLVIPGRMTHHHVPVPKRQEEQTVMIMIQYHRHVLKDAAMFACSPVTG